MWKIFREISCSHFSWKLKGKNLQSFRQIIAAFFARVCEKFRLHFALRKFLHNDLGTRTAFAQIAISERNQLSQAILEFHVTRGTNVALGNANHAIRIAAPRTQGLYEDQTLCFGGDMTANER